MLATINKWFSEPFSQMIVHSDMVTVRESKVFVRLCLGHSLAIPKAILRPLTPNQEHPGELLHTAGPYPPPLIGQSGVTLRLSEAIAPDEADFLYRLASVVIQLTTMIQKSPEARIRMPSPAYHLTPCAKFYLSRADFSLLEGRDKYAVHFGGPLTVKVPASLVNVEEVSSTNKAHTNQTEVYQLTFNSASTLTPLLNQLVQIIFQLVHEFSPLPLPTP
jgi:hypothetical protein